MSMIFFDLDSRVFFFQQFSNIYSHAGIKYLVYMYRYTYWQCCCCFGKWQTMPVGLENIWMWKLTIVAEDATNSRPQTIWIIAHFWRRPLVISNYAALLTPFPALDCMYYTVWRDFFSYSWIRICMKKRNWRGLVQLIHTMRHKMINIYWHVPLSSEIQKRRKINFSVANFRRDRSAAAAAAASTLLFLFMFWQLFDSL